MKDQCQFCKHFDIGHIDCCSIYGECLYNFDNHNRPIGNTSRWELHPDIAEAINEKKECSHIIHEPQAAKGIYVCCLCGAEMGKPKRTSARPAGGE